MSEYVLEMLNISKEYSGNQVLKDVTIRVKPGEIHALLGENGAGKSTLMNILFGMPVISSTGGFGGRVLIDGEESKITSPNDAIHAGIGMVHQEFMLIPGFTVTENIKLNREIGRPNLASRVFGKSMEILDFEAMAKDAEAALRKVGMDIDAYTMVAGLPVGHMQFIEIAREVDKKGIKLLVFDEPTAVLTEQEAATLIKAMKELAASGIAILFITHRLDEVINAADQITILRDGTQVADLAVADATVPKLAELMIGREMDRSELGDPRDLTQEPVVLSVKNLTVDMPGETVKGVNLEVHKGEIFGIGGLAGQGKLGIPNGIMGMYPAEGTVSFEGEAIELNNTKEALHRGLAFVSEDRRGVGLLLEESIEDNIVFSAMQSKGEYLHRFGPFSLKNTGKIRRHAQEMIKLLDIRCTGPGQYTGRLAGGNQQKVCVAKAITLGPKLLFVSEPTRGIDIGAKKLVLDFLSRLNREEGVTVVMVSSELVELKSICDRIAIICEGKVEAIMKPTDSDVDFGLAMSGYQMKEKGGAEGGEN